MKTITSAIASITLLLTCLFGPAAFGQAQSTNAPANALHVNQRYNRGVNSVTYYVVFYQSPDTANKSPYSEEDMRAWGVRILDALDKEFGDKIFTLTPPSNGTPAEKRRTMSDFLPRAETVANKWLRENELPDIVLHSFAAEPTVAPTPDKKAGRGRQKSTGVVYGK